MDAEMLDALFREAVSAIDAGDVCALERLLSTYPHLVRDRLDSPGAWLRDKVGEALDGSFQQPFLLWFVAEDPVRNGKLPKNIATVARMIIEAAQRHGVDSLQEQLDYALRLVCWSWIARESGVQIELIDTLLDSGASLDGDHSDAAIYNGNLKAAEHLVARGASPTLMTALCLGRWADVERMASVATLAEKQDAFVQAALNGNAEALRKMLALGLDPTTASERTQSHGTALHHAVWSGRIEAVKVLVEAGADLRRRDTRYNATPLGWGEHAAEQQNSAANANEPEVNRGGATKQYAEIAAYLREKGGT